MTLLGGVSGGPKMTLGRGGSIYPGFYGDFLSFRAPRPSKMTSENESQLLDLIKKYGFNPPHPLYASEWIQP